MEICDMRNTAKYGKYYWCIKVIPNISPDGEVYLMADRVDTTPDGSIRFIHDRDDGTSCINLLLASGKWIAVYAASVLDGSAIAIEYWKGEIVNDAEDLRNDRNPNDKKGKSHKTTERDRMSQSLRYSIMERDGFVCKMCGRGNGDGIKLEIDHIVPVSKGGQTEASNLQTLCFDCNRGKRNGTQPQ